VNLQLVAFSFSCFNCVCDHWSITQNILSSSD